MYGIIGVYEDCSAENFQPRLSLVALWELQFPTHLERPWERKVARIKLETLKSRTKQLKLYTICARNNIMLKLSTFVLFSYM